MIGGIVLYRSLGERKPIPVAPAAGGKACAGCHAKEYEAWRGSHHDLAMQEANEQTVLGNFANAKFSYADIISTFFKRDGKFYVNTDSQDGKLTDYEIKYTFGVTPLQQYLIEFPDGRLQALSIAWDARRTNEGGQRWFPPLPWRAHYSPGRVALDGHQQNWNFMCADCHSTNLKENYDAATRTFNTTWSELNVSCEGLPWPRLAASGMGAARSL